MPLDLFYFFIKFTGKKFLEKSMYFITKRYDYFNLIVEINA